MLLIVVPGKIMKTPCSPCSLCCEVSNGISVHKLEKDVIRHATSKGIFEAGVHGGRIKSDANKGKGGKCAALEKGRCILHPTKPLRCITFPFRASDDGTMFVPWACRAIRLAAERKPASLFYENGSLWMETSAFKGNEMLEGSLRSASIRNRLNAAPARVSVLVEDADLKHPLIKKIIKNSR